MGRSRSLPGSEGHHLGLSSRQLGMLACPVQAAAGQVENVELLVVIGEAGKWKSAAAPAVVEAVGEGEDGVEWLASDS